MRKQIRRRGLPWMIGAVAVLTAAAAGIAYADNPTASRPGPPVAYAEVNADAALFVDDSGVDAGLPRARNLVQANVSHPETGVYCFSGLSFDPRNAVVSGAASAFTLATVEINPSGQLIDCGPNDTVRVRTVDIRTQALTDERFFIWFEN
jgi:hypothetical protein